MRLGLYLCALLLGLPLSACTSDSTQGSSPANSHSGNQNIEPVDGAPFTSAHRGGAAYAPENTMMAFQNALRLGVDDIEMDAQLTADNVLVILHDDTVDRTTECSGAVPNMSFAEVKNCDAAYWFSPGQPTTKIDQNAEHPLRGQGITVPSLDEVFGWYNALSEPRPTLTIEIKNIPGEANFDPLGTVVAAALVPAIEAAGLLDKVIVQAFHPLSLENAKLLNPNIRTLFLSSFDITATTGLQNLAYTVAADHEFSAPNFETPDMNAVYIETAHAAGKVVIPWTADKEADIRALAAVGVDGVITNFPACSLALAGRPLPASVLPAALSLPANFAICRP